MSFPTSVQTPVERSLRRLRWVLTTWFTVALALGIGALTAIVAVAATGTAAGSVAVFGGIFVVLFSFAAWTLLGYLLAPVTRSLAAQEAFLATAAHDLRTPLATLGVLLASAHRDPGALERAVRLVDRSGDIVSDMLLRARLSAGTVPVTPRPTRLDQLVEGVLADLGTPTATTHPDGSYELALTVDGHELRMSASPVVAHIDPALAERAVANLLHNALQHGHAPGEPAHVAIMVGSDPAGAHVTVTDSGPGLRLPVPSTGLGLSVIRWVARVHDGRLELDTAAAGARLRLRLPGQDA